MTKNGLSAVLKLGDIVQNTYEILEPLGEGGMGATFKARHVALGHLVCVKVIRDGFSADPKALDLFKREANLMREVGNTAGSEAIVKIETLLRDASGTHFLIMEYIDGKPLSHYIALGARLRDQDLVQLAVRLLQGLDAIHRLNIVHRDISPDNIMVPNENILQAKILDFGLASDVYGTEQSILGDSFAGKLGYASPEQLGLFDARMTPKSDIYSLGLVLLAVAGLPVPGKGSMAAAVEARRNDVILTDTRLSDETRAKLQGLLRADPKLRVNLFTQTEGASVRGAEPVAAAIQTRGAAQAFAGPRVARLAAGGLGRVALVVVVLLALGITVWALTRPSAVETASVTPAPEPVTAEPATAEPANPKPVTAEPVTAEPATPEPVIAEPEPAAPVILVPESTPATAPTAAEELQTAQDLIATKDTDNLRQAYTILVTLAQDRTIENTIRANASALIGWMNDPAYFDPKISPLARPDVPTALAAYKFARDLGLFDVQGDINRLSTQ